MNAKFLAKCLLLFTLFGIGWYVSNAYQYSRSVHEQASHPEPLILKWEKAK